MDLSSLNNQQKKAVEMIGGPILVFAGAGSGKTRVLTHKIAHLIEDVGLPPKNILAVTFTNKAAQEMKNRVVDLVNCDISGISIGTFHSISAKILRKYISKLDYSNDFTIYDQQDARSIVKKIIKNLNLDLKQYDPKSFHIRISNAKNMMQLPEYFENISDSHRDEKFYLIYKEYQAILKFNNSVDFDDLLILPIKIFKEFPEVLSYYQNQFQYVLVDEYQDTNKPQFELIYLISKQHKDIFVVGDDDQSIYGWRGADISNILNFKEAFGNASIIKLEQNYRSTKNILEAAWSVVAKNTNRAEKKLWTNNLEGEKILVIEANDERHESKEILKKVKANKNRLNEIAILYRTNSQSRSIEDELRKSGIPYQIIGGTKFYDRKEIKDILSYIKILVNPNDSISFDRIINFPIRGIGKVCLEKIHKYSDNYKVSCYTSLQNIDSIGLSKKQSVELNKFFKMMQGYKNRLNKENASSIVTDLLKDLGLKKYYENLSTVESIDRWDNIEELVSSIEEFENTRDDTSITSYLEEVSLLTDIDNWNQSKEQVTLMTVHSSKGLEFDYINIMGMEDGLFPIVRDYDNDDIEEERRLFYVAITRSKKEVVLTYAKTRRRFGGPPNLTFKSRFLKEIPKNLVECNSKVKFGNFSTNYYKKHEKITDDYNSINVNSIVEHNVFGKGKVLNVEGVGNNAKLTILFINNVTKKLIFKYANLKIIKK